MLSKEYTPTKQTVSARVIKPTDDHVPPMYRTYHLDAANVTEALQDELPFWNCRNPVLVNAPPGNGKTYWLEHTLIPDAIRTNQNVLVLSNRIALSFQQKIDFLRAFDASVAEKYTAKGLIAEENFGSVKILTYHRLPAFMKEKDDAKERWLKRLKYVVADEAHIFTADALFNEHCSQYLRLVTSCFQQAIRIYLTATDMDVLYPLQQEEDKNFLDYHRLVKNEPPRTFLRYVMQPNYSYLNLNWIDDLNEITPNILANEREKWLIFVDSKQLGKKLQQELSKERALFMDSGSKGSDEYNKLLTECKVDAQCLIATAVLDCGINIHDTKVRNVAILSDDRTSFIQMLGRKRVTSGEKVNLYICRPSLEKLNQRRNRYEHAMSYHNRLDTANSSALLQRITQELWREEDMIRKQFFLSNGVAVSDWLCKFMLQKRIDFYNRILDGKSTFDDEVLNWLGLQQDEPKSDPREDLLQFCQKHVDSPMDDEQVEFFRGLVLKAEKQAGISEPQPQRSLKQRALNRRLQQLNLPFFLSSGEWILCAGEN